MGFKATTPEHRMLALKVTAIYVIAAGFWILFSDRILGWFVIDMDLYMEMQTYKGGAFVLITGSLLYLYLNPRIEQLNRSQKKLQDAERSLKKRLEYEVATAECMHILLRSGTIDELLPQLLKVINGTVRCSRTYIFKNEDDPELGLCMSQIAERVSEGIETQIDNPELQHLPYSEGAPTLLPVLKNKQHFAYIVEELDEPERTILAEQGVQSVLILPIFSGNDLWGFIGFDDCIKTRKWQESDIDLLKVIADGIGQSIDHKRAEMELKESEERYKTLNNATFGGIFIHDKGMILECNQGLSDMTGYSKEELVGMCGFALSTNDSKDMIVKNIASGYEEPYEITGVRKDRTKYPVRVQGKNIPYNGKNVRVSELRDLTEQKKAEHSLIEAKMLAEENSRIKSEFLANMSHELRTPLNSVIGFSDLLGVIMKDDLTGKQLGYINHINKSGRHLLELINDILDISKIEAGKMELELESLHISEVLNGVRGSVLPLAQKKNIDIRIIDNINDEDILADRLKLQQILLNLLSNAIKFTPENGEVSIAVRRNEGDTLFSVSDTGIGIPEERQEDIFNPFTQVDASSKREYGGTGLGLALVRQFVEMHGGKIWLESEEGKGTTFTFTICDQ